MGKKFRVLLALAPASLEFIGTEDFALPLGLASIATHMAATLRENVEIKLLNGACLEQKEFINAVRAVKPQLAGFQSTVGNHENSLQAAKACKDLGAFVVFGGHNATFLYENILQNREFVDGVILYEAEEPFRRLSEKILKNKPLSSTPGLAYKKRKEIILPENITIHNLNLLPPINYDFFDLEKHFERSVKAGLGRAINYYSGRGCSRRAASSLIVQPNSGHLFMPFKQFEAAFNGMNSCAFCGRMDMGNRRIRDEKLKLLIDCLYFEKGVRFFWDVWDTYCTTDGQRMFNGGETFRFFARINDINSHYIDLLKKRFGNNIILQIGLESGSQESFNRMNKMIPLDVNQIFRRMVFLRNASIVVDPSFVLGVEGETRETLAETKQFIGKLAALGNVRWLLASPLTLLPGSPFFKKFLQIPEMQEKYGRSDLSDPLEMNADYLSLFADVSREEIIETLKEIKESLPEEVDFGCKGISRKEGRHIGIGRHQSKLLPQAFDQKTFINNEEVLIQVN